MAKTKVETEITEKEYLEAKKVTAEYEAKNIFPFYAKLTLNRETEGTEDIYFNDINLLTTVIISCHKRVNICCLVSKSEFDQYYLPF